MITGTQGLLLNDWADQVCLDLSAYGVIGRLDGANWQDWGAQLLNAVAVSGLPNPYGFDDWSVWGTRLGEAL